MEMCITGYCVMDNTIHSTWKSQSAAFPRPANSVTHNAKVQASYTQSHNAGRLLNSPFPSFHFIKNGGNHHQKRKHRVHGSCAHKGTHHPFTTEYRHAAAPTQRGDSRQYRAAFFIPKNQQIRFFQAAQRQKVRTIWHFLIPQSQYYRHLLLH